MPDYDAVVIGTENGGITFPLSPPSPGAGETGRMRGTLFYGGLSCKGDKR
jgi:hypothetical protein